MFQSGPQKASHLGPPLQPGLRVRPGQVAALEDGRPRGSVLGGSEGDGVDAGHQSRVCPHRRNQVTFS